MTNSLVDRWDRGCDSLALLREADQTITQLHAAVKTAQELAATRLMEIERLRSLLTAACERKGGVCAYGNGSEADRDPCTPENCSTARDAHEPLPCGINESLDRAAEAIRQGRMKIDAALSQGASRDASSEEGK